MAAVLNSIITSSYSLMPHQQDALDAVVKEFKTADRCHIVMACGTGKTITSLAIAEKLNYESIVIFVPSLALINQFMKEWLTHTRWQYYEMLAICSDNSVTESVEEEQSLLWEEANFPVTNDPNEAKKFLKSKNDSIKIIFCTYHSATVLSGLNIELGIFDEAHKTAGYNKSLFGFGLLNSEIKISKRFFMTATPRHGIPRLNKQGEFQELYSMDDESLYGKRCYELGFRKAINLGLICDYKIIVSVIARQTGHKFNTDYEMQEKAISLQKALDESKAKKIITFHSSIAHAKAFAQYLKTEKIHPNVLHINSKVNINERGDMMQRFKDATKAIITNSKCLTEGVDVPTVDMVAFLNPKSSKIDIVQAIGRALRNAPGKERGYIFLPLLINNIDNMEAEIQASEFKVVWEILNALMEQDSDLADTVKNIGKQGGQHLVHSAPDPFLKFLSFNNDNLKKLIEVKILNRLVSPWDTMYEKLCAYKKQHNTVHVSKELDPDLYKWTVTQRGSRSKMSPHRISMLNDIGFEWPKNPEDIWNEKYEELKVFKEEFGHVVVPTRDPKYAQLSNWVEHSRTKIKNKTIDEGKIRKLKELGLGEISGADLREKEWLRKYELLIEYGKKHGTIVVPQRIKENGLGKWCNRQRLLYKNKKLLAHRQKLLEKIGFVFYPDIDIWALRLQENKEWIMNGKPKITEELKNWRATVRKSHKKGGLCTKKIQEIKKSDPSLLDVQVLTTYRLQRLQNESHA